MFQKYFLTRNRSKGCSYIREPPTSYCKSLLVTELLLYDFYLHPTLVVISISPHPTFDCKKFTDGTWFVTRSVNRTNQTVKRFLTYLFQKKVETVTSLIPNLFILLITVRGYWLLNVAVLSLGLVGLRSRIQEKKYGSTRYFHRLFCLQFTLVSLFVNQFPWQNL